MVTLTLAASTVRPGRPGALIISLQKRDSRLQCSTE